MKNSYKKRMKIYVIMNRALWSEYLVWNLDFAFYLPSYLRQVTKKPSFFLDIKIMENEQLTVCNS